MQKTVFSYRCLAMLVITIAIILSRLLPVYADTEKDYNIEDAYMEMKDDGSVWAGWTKAKSLTSYKVQLQAMKNGQWVDVGKLVATDNTKYDYSKIIAETGTAYYRIYVFPVKGGPAKYKIYSATTKEESLALDSGAITNVKAYADAKNKEKINAGWEQTSDGSWIYYDANKNQVKDGWVRDNGYYYYLNDSGKMVKGWQAIDGKWYYLEPEGIEGHPQGSRWSNTTTPDGYKLDKNGIRLKEDGSADITTENTVTSDSYVKVKLNKPTNFSINKSGSLQWDKVENAANYQVDVAVDGTRYFTLTTTSPTMKIYTDDDGTNSSNKVFEDGIIRKGDSDKIEGTVALQISACSEKIGNKYTKTKAVEIADLGQFVEDNSYGGQFKNANGKLCYLDEDGNKVTGWQRIGGCWYYFDDKGYAAGPGWFEDNGYTYYFDDTHKMAVGERTIDGSVYHFNDGSDSTIPYGALIK